MHKDRHDTKPNRDIQDAEMQNSKKTLNEIGRVDVNFIRTTRPSDLQLFFQDESAVELEDRQNTIAHLLAAAGILKSVSEGKKNGWNKPIPLGFSQFVVGKLKGRITVFNENTEEI